MYKLICAVKVLVATVNSPALLYLLSIFISWTRVSTDHIVRGGPQPPKKRYGHTMVTFNRCLYIFGGATGQILPNDIHW